MSEKKVRQWELKGDSGPHIHKNEDGDKIVYEPGEVIHTHKDLGTLFPCKFIELGISKKATLKKKSKLRDDDEPEKPRRKKAKETEEEPTKVEEDDEIDDEDDEEEEEEEEDTTTEDEPAPPPRSKKYGKDVTKDFEIAVKADLKVFKSKKKGFSVVDNDTSKAIKTKKPLKTVSQVDKFLSDYKKG